MPEGVTPRTRTALLVIDLQLGMFAAGGTPIHAGDALLTRVQMLLAQARAAGTPIIYVRHDGGPGDTLEHGTAQWHIHPAIAPVAGDVIVDKRTPDAFHETSLAATLAALGARRLVVAGAQTEFCVDTTCRRAFSLGFETLLVSDAHSTWDTESLTADQIIRHTNQTLSGWFVSLVSTNDVRSEGFGNKTG